MEQLIEQITGMLSDARAFTPELVARIQPIMLALAQFKVTVGIILMATGAALGVVSFFGSRACYKQYQKVGIYSSWDIGGGATAAVGGIVSTALFFSGLGSIILWSFYGEMISADMLAFLAMKGIGF
jgi:hypothetical protein